MERDEKMPGCQAMDEEYMQLALVQAHMAAEMGEVPVGCIIVKDGHVIAEGKNMRECRKNAIHHAEIEAINKACEVLGERRLKGCELYVTLEPCPMCAGAIFNAGIDTVVFGAFDSNMGACGGVINIFEEAFGFKPHLYGGFMKEECAAILKDFFIKLR